MNYETVPRDLKQSFKYEDIKSALELLEQGSYVFPLTSSQHITTQIFSQNI